MERWPLRLLPYFFTVFVCLSTKLNSQTTTSGALTGVVTDQSRAVVANADVQIKNTSKGDIQSTKTDSEGVYRFHFLTPGRYVLIVGHTGFRAERRTVDVLLGPPVSVNVRLDIAKASSEIRVTGEVPLIHAENGDVSATINETQISELPNPGNDLTNIAQIAPGVVMNTQQSGPPFSILGMPGTSYLYTIDGLNVTNNADNSNHSGSMALLLGQNQIQEASVVTTGYSGQFGGAAGGNINYVTKSGSNQFHGNAEYYWNGRILNANDWFNNAFRLPRPFDIANQWAGSIGGPIKKDKLFFFFDNEGLRVLIPQTFGVQRPSPQFEAATIANIDSKFGSSSASDTFYRQIFNIYNGAVADSGPLTNPFDPLGCSGFQDPKTGLGISVPCAVNFLRARTAPNQQMLISGRLDWNISKSDRAFLRLQYDGGRSALDLDPVDPVFDVDFRVPWWQGQIIETHSFSTSAASQFLFAASSVLYSAQMPHAARALAALPTELSFSAQGTFNDLGHGDWVNPLGNDHGPIDFQISEDLLKTWHSHKLGLGANFEIIHWYWGLYSFDVIGVLRPQTLDAFYYGGVGTTTDQIDFTQLSQSFPTALTQRLTYHNLGLYAQDEWHVRKNLSVTFAIRAAHQSNPTCEHRCFTRLAGPFESVSHDPDQPYNQAIFMNQRQALAATDPILWSPRFSFAWQPFGGSRGTVLRGGLGVFYDSVPGLLAYILSTNTPLVNSYTVANDNLAPGERTNLFKDAAASNAAFVNGFVAGETLAQIQAAVSRVSPTGFSPPAITVPDGITHSPQYQKWSFELQQVIGVHSSMNVGYFGHHGIHGLVQNPSANAFGFGSLPKSMCSSPPVPPCADPRFSQVTTLSSGAVSNYNGMVASFQHRFSGWTPGLFQINYTLGHALDEVSDGGLDSFTFGSSLFPQDARNLRRSYGPAEYDVRHSLNANYVWELPLKTALGGHGANALVKGWQVSGTVITQSGFSYSVFDNFEQGILQQKNFFGPIYAVPVGPLGSDPPCGESAAVTRATHPCQPPQLLADGKTPNPQARFAQAGCETGFDAGNLPGPLGPCSGRAVSFVQSRNRFRGGSYFNTDFTIMKNTNIPRWENASFALGFQFFNLPNHPNFGFPDSNLADPVFGQILGPTGPTTSLLGNINTGGIVRRLIQVKGQLRF